MLECEGTDRGEENIDPDYYALVKQSVTRLQTAQTLDDFCRIVAEQVRAPTGLDRVMVYRFHKDFHGEVVAESKREELSGWFGLHYPAEDIPKPAREIFKKIWIRPLPDARAPVMELVPLVNPRHGQTAEHDALLSARCVGNVYGVNSMPKWAIFRGESSAQLGSF